MCTSWSIVELYNLRPVRPAQHRSAVFFECMFTEPIMSHTTSTTAHNHQAIEDCTECAQVVKSTIEHCLSLGGKHAEEEHIAMMRECAAICQKTANDISRKAADIEAICKACAEVCEACDHECRSFDHDHAMTACADACKKAAASCNAMAAA